MPGKTQSLAELVDFYATVMDYAGVTPTHDQFGISLRPVIENTETKIRDYAFSEGGRRPCEKQADEYHKYGDAGPSKTSDYWAKMNAEADDDTDASQCAAKARCDRVDDTKCFSVLKCDVEQRHSAYNTDDYCTDDQRQKCLDLGLKNHEDKANNTDCKTDQHSLSA